MDPFSFSLTEISHEDTHLVRQPVLRPGRPIAECIFPGDEEKDTFHLGIYSQDELAAVASFMKNKNPEFKDEIQYQLRGMAVLPEFRKLNYGAALLLEGESKLIQKYGRLLLWFNARDYAVGFYEKYDYTKIGEYFEVPGVCMHVKMFKNL